MGSNETEPLLRDKPNSGDSKDGSKDGSKDRGTWRRFIILAIVEFLYLQTTGLMGYILSEWIQNTVKMEYFPNQTFAENVSSCENQNHSSADYKMYTRVQQESAHWIMYYNIAQRVTAFISNLIWPTYTDSYGRKFLFIMTTAFLTIRTGLLSFIIRTSQSFVYIIVWFGFEGFFGTSFALINVSFLFVADEFEDKNARVLAVVAVEANILMTNMVSGLISGLFVDNLGFFIPTLVCLGMASTSLVVTLLFLPETLKPEGRRKAPNVLSVMRRPLEFYTSSAFAGKRTEYFLLILAFAFGSLGTQNRTTIETVFLLGMPFCWTPTLIGYFELARHFGQAVFGLGSVKLCQKFLSNEWIAINSTVFCILSYVVTGFATSQILIYSGLFYKF